MPRKKKLRHAQARCWVGYCRKSTDTEDKQVHSLQDQAALIEEYYDRLPAAEKESCPLRLLSEAQSAYRPGRPVFNQILQMASRGEVYGMIVVHPNRLSRNHADSGSFVQRLVDRQIACLDTTGGKRYTGADSNDIFMLTLEGAMSWKDSRDKGDRILQAMRLRAKEGRHMGPVRIGYRIVYHPDGSKALELAPDVAPVLRHLFELAAAGTHSIQDLVNEGWERGLRGRNGKKVCPSAIHAILHDPIYKGYVRFDGILARGVHQPIVDEAVWERVQDVLAGRRTDGARPKDLTLRDLFFFGSLLRCPRCGASLCAYRAKGKYVYYECKNRETRCGVCVPQQTLVEQLPLRLGGALLGPPDVEDLRKQLVAHYRQSNGNDRGLRRRLNEEYEGVQAEIADVFGQRAQAAALGVLDAVDRRLAELKKKREVLQNQLNRTHDKATERIEKVVRAFELVNLLQEAIFAGSRHPREMVLKAVGSNFTVDEKKLVLKLRSPFRQSAERRGVLEWWAELDDVRTEIEETVELLETAYKAIQSLFLWQNVYGKD